MKKILLLLLGIAYQIYPQSQNFTLGNFNFFLSPKFLEEGSILDVGLGLQYTDTWGGELRFRNTAISKNEDLLAAEDSLNAVTSNVFEVFFLPVEYSFIRTPKTRVWIGGGAYYEYNTLREKGFFNMPELENFGWERVNSFTNDFSMHLGGPLIDLGVTYKLDLFEIDWLDLGRFGIDVTLSGGIVPVFFLFSHQKMGMIPLMDPHYAEYDQTNWGSPYLYLRFESNILRFINLVLLYDYSKLSYKDIDFESKGTNLQWINHERTFTTQSFKIEASLLLPLGTMQVQIGYGYTFDTTRHDAGTSVESNRQYLILTAKKNGG